MLQLLGNSCWYCDNYITKKWAHHSYFLYLYMVFFQHCFHLEQHCFHLDRQFSCSPNIPNWLNRVLNSNKSNNTELLFLRLACTLSPLLHKFSVSVFKSYHNIFHSWCYIRFTYIIITNVFQHQTSFTPIDFVHLAFFSIRYKMHSPCNVSGMFGILTILSHAYIRFTIQDNQRSFLWNYIWILV